MCITRLVPTSGFGHERMSGREPKGKEMSSQPDYQPIFHVGNKHAANSGNPPHIDGNIRKRYHGYFENEFGEQAISSMTTKSKREHCIWGMRDGKEPFKVVNARVPELVLGKKRSSVVV